MENEVKGMREGGGKVEDVEGSERGSQKEGVSEKDRGGAGIESR